MLPELLSHWDAVEAGKSEIVRRARALPPEVFVAPRKPGQWSYAQMLQHLAIAEGEVTGQIAALKAVQNPADLPKTSPVFVPLLSKLLRWGVPLPAPPNMLPPESPLTLAESETLWNEKRVALKARLEALGTGDLAAPIALHPIAGPLNARQVLALADAHQRYHLRQFPK